MSAISYLLILATLALGVLRKPAVAIPAAICMFGIEQWGQTSKAALASQNATFTNIAIGVLVLVAVARRFLRGDCMLCGLSAVYWLVLGLFAYAFCSLVWGSSSPVILHQWELAYPYIITLVVLTPLVCSRSTDFNVALRWLVGIGAALSFAVLFFADWGRRGVMIDAGMYAREANPLAIASMAGQVAFTVLLYPMARSKVLRWGIAIAVASVCLAVVVRSGSRGQLLGCLAALAIAWPMARKGALTWRLIVAPVVVALFATVAYVSLDLSGAEVGRWQDADRASGDIEGRFDAALLILQHSFSNPGTLLFGLGNSAAWEIYGIYPHIVPLEILAEEGVVGFSLFVAILLMCARRVFAALGTARLSDEKRAAFACFVAGLVFHFVLSLKEGSLLGSPLLFTHAILVARFAYAIQAERSQERKRQQKAALRVRAPVAAGAMMLITGVALLLAPDGAQAAVNCPRFFELLAHTGKPDLRTLGIQPARVFGPQDFWEKGKTRDVVPGAAAVERGLALRPRNGQPVVLDIEHWAFRGSDSEVGASAQRLLTLLSRVRGIEADTPVGFYAIPPVRDYWRAIRPQDSPLYVEWQRDNDRFQTLAEAVDILFPSLYTFHDDVAGWRRYAIANLSEARRLAGTKPVYAFLWPQFTSSDKALNYRYLDAAFWRTQLEVVAEHADGIVLWGGWQVDGTRARWDGSAPWWIETERFIRDRNTHECDQR